MFTIVPNLISVSFISNLYTSVSLNSSSVIPSSFSSSSSFEVSWERSDDLGHINRQGFCNLWEFEAFSYSCTTLFRFLDESYEGKSNDGSKFEGLLVRLDFASEPFSVVRCSLEHPGSNFTVTDASASFIVTLTNRSASRPG